MHYGEDGEHAETHEMRQRKPGRTQPFEERSAEHEKRGAAENGERGLPVDMTGRVGQDEFVRHRSDDNPRDDQ